VFRSSHGSKKKEGRIQNTPEFVGCFVAYFFRDLSHSPHPPRRALHRTLLFRIILPDSGFPYSLLLLSVKTKFASCISFGSSFFVYDPFLWFSVLYTIPMHSLAFDSEILGREDTSMDTCLDPLLFWPLIWFVIIGREHRPRKIDNR